jgi:hypothetical protein
LHSARGRVLWVRSVEAAIQIACVVLACFAALLLAGADVVGWSFLWLVAGVALVFSVLHVRRSMPDTYLLAQKLDLEWGLHDVLSTAWYAIESGIDTPSAHRVFSSAGASAHAVDVKATFRVRGRKTGFLAACLLVSVCVLLGARYRSVGHLDLHPSCLALWFPAARETPPDATKPQTRQMVASIAPERDTPGVDSNGAYDGRSSTPQGKPPEKTAETRSTWDRFKDALSKLLNPDASDSGSANQEQEAAKENSTEKDKGNKAGHDGHGAKAAEQGQKATNQDSSRTADAAAQNAQTQKPDSGASAASGQKNGGAENSAESGAGSDDGSKRIENAAELKAMGKIEELMGKQASKVSGEMSIVKTSGPQQLSTGFDGRQAVHTAAETELHDGGVPPEQREFVRKYMDELHRVTDSQGK